MALREARAMCPDILSILYLRCKILANSLYGIFGKSFQFSI